MGAAAWLAARLPTWALLGLYRLGPITRLLRALLNRAVPPGFSEVSVAGGRLAGARMLLDLREEKDLWLGAYEPFVLEAIGRFTRPGMTAYDVGAHIGFITLALARAVGEAGRVVAFEPLPANLERLRANLELNGLSGRVEVVEAAVGESAGRRQFQVHTSVSMGRLAAAGAQAGTGSEVEVLALDAYAEDQAAAPDLIKMDIEGGEAGALRGMHRLLRRSRPILLLELHEGQAAGPLLEVLRQAGYEIRRLTPGYPLIGSAQELARKACVLGLPVDGSTTEQA
jgi:FkbM family methyltransferase